MNLNDKIKQILTDKNISPSHFADEIGIQRSSISHILAGRNKPSLEIVQKVVRRFPELGLNWILDDEELPAANATTSKEVTDYQSRKVEKPQIDHPLESNEKFYPASGSLQSNVTPIVKQAVVPEKKIERVIIFFTDGSFQEYKS